MFHGLRRRSSAATGLSGGRTTRNSIWCRSSSVNRPLSVINRSRKSTLEYDVNSKRCSNAEAGWTGEPISCRCIWCRTVSTRLSLSSGCGVRSVAGTATLLVISLFWLGPDNRSSPIINNFLNGKETKCIQSINSFRLEFVFVLVKMTYFEKWWFLFNALLLSHGGRVQSIGLCSIATTNFE